MRMNSIFERSASEASDGEKTSSFSRTKLSIGTELA